MLTQVLRQSMEMMRNPEAMRQAMRSQDLAMSQLENLPGGFNALRNMFEEMHEPMMDAMSGSTPGTQSQSGTGTGTSQAPTAPVNSAMPNPWGGGSSTGTAPAPGAAGINPFAALGGTGAGAGGFPGGFPGAFPGAFPGGAGGEDMALEALLNNPAMLQMMTNPAFLEQMASQSPMVQAMLQNPQTRALMTNPEALRAALQMSQSMRTLQRAGLQPGGGMGGMGGGAGLDFSALLGGGMGGMGAFGGMGGMGGMGGFPGMPPVAGTTATPPVQNPEERYAAQLQQLQDMGFSDRAANIRALQATQGNVHAAVERLLGGM